MYSTPLLKNPSFYAIAFIASLLMLILLVWLFGFQSLFHVIFITGLPLEERLSFMFEGVTNSFRHISDPVAAMRILFAVLFGATMGAYYCEDASQKALHTAKWLIISGATVAMITAGISAAYVGIASLDATPTAVPINLIGTGIASVMVGWGLWLLVKKPSATA